MAKWPIKRLEDLCQVTSSKRIYAKELVSSGVPFLKSKEIIEKVNGREHSSLLYISEERFQEIGALTGHLQAGDVLLTSRGTLGTPYVVSADDRFHFADGNLTWFRHFNQLDSRYLAYLLLSPSGKAELTRCVIGAAQPAYTIAALKKIKIPHPPLPTQRRITSILSAYDDLIENNTKRIEILEEMARSLYREWFVHFRFPGHEKVKLVDSELGKIPEGWEVTTVGDWGEVVTGKTPPKKNPELFGADIPFLKLPDMHGQVFAIATEEGLSMAGAASQASKTLPPDSVCVSCIGSAGVVNITALPTQTNQQINALVPTREIVREYLYFVLKGKKEELEQLGSNGATMTNVNKAKFSGMKLLRPEDDLLESYHGLSSPMLDLIRTLQRKTSTLRQTRDLLLPKLISGAIDVDALDLPEAG